MRLQFKLNKIAKAAIIIRVEHVTVALTIHVSEFLDPSGRSLNERLVELFDRKFARFDFFIGECVQ